MHKYKHLPIITFGGDTKVRMSRKSTKIATITPVLLIRSMSVIFTAFAERTRNITDILKYIYVSKHEYENPTKRCPLAIFYILPKNLRSLYIFHFLRNSYFSFQAWWDKAVSKRMNEVFLVSYLLSIIVLYRLLCVSEEIDSNTLWKLFRGIVITLSWKDLKVVISPLNIATRFILQRKYTINF